MAQFERKMQITYRWWNDEAEEIPSDHQIHLEDEAEDRINNMRKEGYTSGELNSTIGDTDYRGHWEFTYVSDKEHKIDECPKCAKYAKEKHNNRNNHLY